MNKKNLLGTFLLSSYVFVLADNLSANLILMNSYMVRKNSDIWTRMRVGFKLAHVQTDRVQYFERMYTRNPKTFNKMMNNAIPFLYYMLNETELGGLPSELTLIPGVESTFDPLAKNPGDAYAGMWQFVSTTGLRFNMAQNDQIDQRRDIVKSTQAAFSYLTYLYSIFRQWDVAIGAYNIGEGAMYRAILNSGESLGHVNYSNLQFRQITKDYVPRVIALASIIDNPSKFGVTLDDTAQDQPYFAVVNSPKPTNINELMMQSGIDRNMFNKLNGQYKSDSYIIKQEDNVLLPVANQEKYYSSLGVIPQVAPQRVASAPQIQIVTNSENKIQGVAAPVDDKLDELIKQLNVESRAKIADNLINEAQKHTNKLANVNTQSMISHANKPTIALGFISYKVVVGDTLYSISKKFRTNIKQIKQQNHILGNTLHIGQTLKIKTSNSVKL